jgi:acetylornithine/succinyldiaminopimelate/putrescine aminotransferase
MIQSVCLSLSDLLGSSYIDSVCRASAALGLGTYDSLLELGQRKVDFYPAELADFLDAQLEQSGEALFPAFAGSSAGAGTQAFEAALHRQSAPLSGLGFFRLPEDGCPALIAKSEHYQASLGHNFPGYGLLQFAARIGITNITHNNTRGHVTRLLERELIRVANGLQREEQEQLEALIASDEPHLLNRVLNLQTGSLACEAALKMMLARFYRLQDNFPEPVHSGKTPVFLVMGDFKGGKEANYHGTNILNQLLRGMWPGLAARMEAAGIYKCQPVPINDYAAFAEIFAREHSGNSRVAGFMHELVLMNYGGIRLQNAYVQACHKLCQENEVPVFIDEIQSCMWSPEMLLYKEYGCRPDFVAIGKGFSGGTYPASRLLCSAKMDNLNQFGALVTNGQEELASLAYLITMRFAEENAAHIKEAGLSWQKMLTELQGKNTHLIKKIEGDGLLASIFFHQAEKAVQFCQKMQEKHHVDISAQTYKADCPPAALSKLPLIASEKMMRRIIAKMSVSLNELQA